MDETGTMTTNTWNLQFQTGLPNHFTKLNLATVKNYFH